MAPVLIKKSVNWFSTSRVIRGTIGVPPSGALCRGSFLSLTKLSAFRRKGLGVDD